MIDSALFDVPCPHCGAEVLELCTTGGRYMEATVHGPRRIRADVPLIAETTPANPDLCKSGRHAWVEANIYTAPSGNRHCQPCRSVRQRSRKGSVHRNNGPRCRKGHEYTAENTYVPPNGGPRRCITCKKNQRTNDYAKKKEAA